MKPLFSLLNSFCISIVPIFLFLKRKYLFRPRVRIEVKPGDHHYCHKKWSNNKYSIEGKPLFIYELCWTYRMILTNISDHVAFYPRIKFDKATPHSNQLTVLSHYAPINISEQVVLEGQYLKLIEQPEGFACDTAGIPEDLLKTKILLEYKNEGGTTFFTLYDPLFKRNNYQRVKSIEFSL